VFSLGLIDRAGMFRTAVHQYITARYLPAQAKRQRGRVINRILFKATGE